MCQQLTLYWRWMSKYRISRPENRTYRGILFDSQAEMYRYIELEQMVKAKKIKNLSHHVVYTIYPPIKQWDTGKKWRPITYEVDFEYTEKGQLVWEDVKGMITQAYRIKRKLIIDYCNKTKIVFREVFVK